MEKKDKSLILFGIFLLFILLRLFGDSDLLFLSSDNLKYLSAAQSFPHHLLYNDEVYLLHPPLFPYFIYGFGLIFGSLERGALMLSLFSAIASFFVLYRLLSVFMRDERRILLTLFLFSLSVPFVGIAHSLLRESFVILLIMTSLLLFSEGVRKKSMTSMIACAISTFTLALSSDHVVFIFPAFFILYLTLSETPISFSPLKIPLLILILIPILAGGLGYCSWLLFKYEKYSEAEYYPNGYEGTPIKISSISLFSLISPQFFEDHHGTEFSDDGALRFIKHLAFNAGYMFNLFPFSIPEGLNFSTMSFLLKPIHVFFMLTLYPFLALCAVIGAIGLIREAWKNRKISANLPLIPLLLFLLFALPILEGQASPRYILTTYIFLFVFISAGFFVLSDGPLSTFFAKLNRKRIIALFLIFAIALGAFWTSTHTFFIPSSEFVYSASATSAYLQENIPKNAVIMAQPGYGAKLIYQTENKVIGLHSLPSRLPEIIDQYNVSYAVVGRYYTFDAQHLSKDSVLYIMENPDSYQLIAKIKEDYSRFFGEKDPAHSDEVYVYKVIR